MKKEKLRTENISFQYPGAASYALKDVSFSLYEGEWVAVIGHNGSGKSTLAKLLNGLFLPESGKITLNDTNDFIRGNSMGCSKANWHGISKSR